VSLPRLYAVLDTGVAAGRGWTVADLGQAFLDGGAQLIQLRAKHLDARTLLEAADRLVRLPSALSTALQRRTPATRPSASSWFAMPRRPPTRGLWSPSAASRWQPRPT